MISLEKVSHINRHKQTYTCYSKLGMLALVVFVCISALGKQSNKATKQVTKQLFSMVVFVTCETYN